MTEGGMDRPVPPVDELTIDLEPHDDSWFQSQLLECVNALGEVGEKDEQRIHGRVFVLRDLFGLSEDDVVEIAERFGKGDDMAALLEVER